MPVAFLLLASSRLNTRMPSFNKWQSLGGAMLLATTVLLFAIRYDYKIMSKGGDW